MAKKGRRPPPRSAVPRGGTPAMPDMQALMAQAAEMQASLAEKQRVLAEQTYEGSAGGGVVTAVITGAGDLVSVEIGSSVIDPDDPQLIGDLVVAAVNQATTKMREAAASVMGLPALPEGLDLGSLGMGDLGGLLG